MADGHDEDDELGLLKLADDAIVAQAIARQAKCIWTKRSERIKDAALKGGATKAQLAKGARVLRPADARGTEIPHMRRPTLSQERKRKKKSACSVRNDSGGCAERRTGRKACPTRRGTMARLTRRYAASRGLCGKGFD